jgi:hypothetical protein
LIRGGIRFSAENANVVAPQKAPDQPGLFLGVPSMNDSLEVEVLYPA